MNLYKLSQTINEDYDTYDSAIVCAENEEEARHIHPSEFVTHYKDGKWYGTYAVAPYSEYETENCFRSWVKFEDLDQVKVELIGEAEANIKKGVVLASFNAG